MIKWFRSRNSMRKIGHKFFDALGGDPIYEWIDCYGDHWLAAWRWGFRIKPLFPLKDESTTSLVNSTFEKREGEDE